MTFQNINNLTQENIHSQFHIKNFESITNNLYEINNIQIVHKRRVSKRLYFFDARFYLNRHNLDSCEICNKVSFILKYPELEIDTIHNIQKNTKLGDKIKVICWVENMSKKNEAEIQNDCDSINNTILFHIKEIEIIEKYDNKIAFVPELPIIEKRNKGNLNNKKSENENKNENKNIENEKAEKNNLILNSNSEVKKGICKFWLNGRNCLRGKDCPFRHITNEELKKQWIDEVSFYRIFTFFN